jgi:hypothetical protein
MDGRKTPDGTVHRKPQTKEIVMSMFIRSALIAVAILGGASAASARIYQSDENGRTPSSYDLNSPSDARSFWDAQRTGGH